MAAITMPSISSLPDILGSAYPQFSFQKGDIFKWSAAEQSIYFKPIESLHDAWSLLHELGHALLGHADYSSDIQLIRKETEAWEHAVMLALQFDLLIDRDYIEDTLDTYRDWLHSRSRCPRCGTTGVQAQTIYTCSNCECSWHANDARTCALRRYVL